MASLGRDHISPINLQCVATDNVSRRFQWNANIALAESLAKFIVHYVVHHPHCRPRDLCWKLADLNPKKLIDINFAEKNSVQFPLIARDQFAQNINLQSP